MRKTGNTGECIALEYLQRNGYRICATNFCVSGGEIDIIAKLPHSSQTIFFEVKFRKSFVFGTPEEALTFRKKKLLARTIQIYCLQKKISLEYVRCDFISISCKKTFYQIRHYKNIALG